MRHACHSLPAVGLRVVDLHRVEQDSTASAAHGVDLAVKHHRGMGTALHAHARHQSPSVKLRVVGLDRFEY
eukprot:scaffold40941_cov50-Phaeocystis_antarctica.AAC.3